MTRSTIGAPAEPAATPATGPITAPTPVAASTPVAAPGPVTASEPITAPGPVTASEPVAAPGPVTASEPITAPGPVATPGRAAGPGESLAYRDACRRGELVVQRCAVCARRTYPPVAECPGCGAAEPPCEPVSGDGTVHTFTVVHRSFVPAFQGREPYVLAWIDLPEGVRAFGQIVECPPDLVRIGMPVRVTFVDDLPQWRPV